MRWPSLIIAILILNVSCQKKKNDENKLYVYAAASLTNVVREFADQFEKENNCKVILNLASSGTLARQIESGAKCDIYISANTKWVNYLERKNVVESSNRFDFLGNQLVIIQNKKNAHDYSLDPKKLQLSNSIKMAIADPMHVPAGIYSKEYLQNIGEYEALKQNIITAIDVRATLLLVEMNEADLGIVYRTDAIQSEKVKIVMEVPDSLHQNILYSEALITSSELAKEFHKFIYSTHQIERWEKFGFQYKE